MKRIKLRLWVKVVITLIIMGLMIYLYNKCGDSTIDFKIFFWLLYIPFSFTGLSLLWEC